MRSSTLVLSTFLQRRQLLNTWPKCLFCSSPKNFILDPAVDDHHSDAGLEPEHKLYWKSFLWLDNSIIELIQRTKERFPSPSKYCDEVDKERRMERVIWDSRVVSDRLISSVLSGARTKAVSPLPTNPLNMVTISPSKEHRTGMSIHDVWFKPNQSNPLNMVING